MDTDTNIDDRRHCAGGLGDLGLAGHSAGLSKRYAIHPSSRGLPRSGPSLKFPRAPGERAIIQPKSR
jgi:hypothetical protein